MKQLKSKVAVAGILSATVALVFAGGAGAQAAGLIGSPQIKNGSVRSIDIHNGTIGLADLRPGTIAKLTAPAKDGAPGMDGKDGKDGKDGAPGKDGQNGRDGLAGAYYSVAYYNAGDTNAGAIATVACKDITDVAISGGVQVLGLDAGANSRNTPVSSSFPGRMDWATNAPKPDRLDGWIVQFGGNAGATSDTPPEKVKVYALCVPGAPITVEQTFSQVG